MKANLLLFVFLRLCLSENIYEEQSVLKGIFLLHIWTGSVDKDLNNAMNPVISPVLRAYLDPLHVKVGVVRSPVPRVHAAVDLHHNVLNPSRTNRLTWEVFLSGFCKTLPLREEIIMVAEVEAEAVADMIELSLLNVC